MRSVRLEPELEAELEAAAKATGRPVSHIIREAVRRRCRELKDDRLDARLADVIGVISGGGNARNTGRDFAEMLLEKDRKRGRRHRS